MTVVTRELRAERFRRSGGRRRDDQPSGRSGAHALPRDKKQLMTLAVVGAATSLAGCLIGLLAGYLLFS